MNFCSNCGSDHLNFSIPEGDNVARYWCASCKTIHYQNPKIIVGCLPVYKNKVLLCKRAIPPRYGLWNLPAGFMENGETTEQGAMRETWEEAQAEVTIVKLHCVYSIPHVNQVYLHFLAHLKEPVFASGPESLEVDLFSPEEIPWADMAFSSSTFALEKYIAEKDYTGVHLGSHQPAIH